MPAKRSVATQTRLAHLCCRLMTRRSADTRAMRATTLFAALVLALLLAAGCGGDDPSPTATATPTSTATATAPPTADGPPSWHTLGKVIARDELRCGVKQTQPLFGFRAADSTYSGFDIEFCKAIAAAVLGDSRKVHYVDASDAATRFELLINAEIDVLIRTTTHTASRDRELGLDYAQPILYAGQGFVVRKNSGIESTSDMGDAVICVSDGTSYYRNLADHLADIGLAYDPLLLASFDYQDVADAFFSGRCDVLTGGRCRPSPRASHIRDDADDYIILPQIYLEGAARSRRAGLRQRVEGRGQLGGARPDRG